MTESTACTFGKESDKYNLHRPSYPAGVYEYLASRCSEKTMAWDCACGNGQVARHLVKFFQSVEASDMSENQIEHAYRHERINYSVQKSESTVFPDSCFDLICVAEAIHWFDIPKFYDEVKRTLKPGGLFSCWGYNSVRCEKSVNEIVKEILLSAIKPYSSHKNKMIRDRYETIGFPFKKIDVPEFKMIMNWNMDQFLNYVRTWSGYKIYRRENTHNLLAELEERLSEVWEQGTVKNFDMGFFMLAGHME